MVFTLEALGGGAAFPNCAGEAMWECASSSLAATFRQFCRSNVINVHLVDERRVSGTRGGQQNARRITPAGV
jgi:hypothetical protein